MMPRLSRRPVDRPELTADLLAKLSTRSGRTVGVTTVLHGAGGFGKTTLASYVCSRTQMRELFPGGLLWITVGQDRHGADLASAANDLCEHLIGARPGFTDPEQAGHHLGALLDEGPPTLLVVDDVWDDNQLRPFLLGGEQCTRLITTRIPGVIPEDADLVQVDQMEQSESEVLLESDLPRIPAKQRRQLLELTGRWPLLLSLVNAALRRAVRNGADPGVAAADLVERLSSQGPTALDVRGAYGRDRAVEATVEISLALLKATDRERYLELAIFAEDVDIPHDTLTLLWGSTGGLPGSFVTRLVEDLTDLSLLAAYQPTERTIRLHDVLRQYLRHRCGEERLGTLNKTFLDTARHLLPQPSSPTPWWQLPSERDYLWQHLCYHLSEAGRIEELSTLVSDLRWAAAKSERYDVAALEVDLERTDHKAARELQYAVAREAHVLGRISPAHSHADLLISRLQGGSREIDDLIARYRDTLPADEARIDNGWPLPGHDDKALLRVLTGQNGPLTNCTVSPSDAETIATCGQDSTIRVWNRGTGQQRYQLRGHSGTVTDCAFSDDGLVLFSTSRDGTAAVWDTIARKRRFTLQGHAGSVNACAVAPSGALVVTVGNDGTARLWDVATGQASRVIEVDDHPVVGCAIDPNQNWLFTISASGRLRQWNLTTGDLLQRVRAHIEQANSCVVSPDGTTVVTGGDKVVKLWNAADLSPLGELTGHTGWVNRCAVSPDSRCVLSASDDGTVRVWDLHERASRTLLQGHNHYVSGCAFSPDGSYVVSAGWDQTARIWRLKSGGIDTTVKAQRSRTSACAAASGKLVTAGWDGTTHVWDADGPRQCDPLQGRHDGKISACDITADGGLVLTAGFDQQARIWEAATKSLVRTLTAHTAPIESCRFSPDGSLAVTGGQDNRAIIWRIPSGEVEAVLTGHENWISCCAYRSDGGLIATAGWDGTVRLWTPQGDPYGVLTQDSVPVHCCAFFEGGTRIVSGRGDGLVHVRSAAWKDDAALVLRGHDDAVYCCAVSPDDRWLATGSRDATIRIWDLTTAANVASMRVACEVQGIAWRAPDSLCAVGSAGVHVFRFIPPAAR